MIKKAEKLTKLGIAVDDHMLNRIESYRFGNWIQTRNEALLRIIEIGLSQIEKASEKSDHQSGDKLNEDFIDHEDDGISIDVDHDETENTLSGDQEPV